MIIFCGGTSYDLGRTCYDLCVFLLSQNGEMPVKGNSCQVAEEIDTYLKILGETSLPYIIQYSTLSDLAVEKIRDGSALSIYLYEDLREILTRVNQKTSFARRFLEIWRDGEENRLPPLDRTLVIEQKNLDLDPDRETSRLAEYLGVTTPSEAYAPGQSEVVNKRELTREQRLLVETLLDEILWQFGAEDKNDLTVSREQNLAGIRLESLLLQLEQLLVTVSNFRDDIKTRYYDSLDKKLVDYLINTARLEEAAGICDFLGNISLRDNEPERSKRWYLKALKAQPQQAKYLYKSGYLHEEGGDWQGAKGFYERAVSINPKYTEAHYRAGLIYKRNKQIKEAIEKFSEVLQLEANHQGAKFNLASFWKQGEEVEYIAGTLGEKDLELLAELRESLNQKGVILFQKGDLEPAGICFQSLIELDPDCLWGYFNLARVLHEQKNYPRAVAAYNKVLKMDENYTDAIKGLGYVHYETKEFELARQCFRKALEIEPDNGEIYSILGHIAAEQGSASDAINLFDEALKLDPDRGNYHSAFLFNLTSLDTFTPREIFDSSRLWYDRQVVEKRLPFVDARSLDTGPQRRLRIGYISPDFRQHSIGRLIKPILAHHDRSKVEVFCYGEVSEPDRVTDEIVDICDGWRYTQGLSDIELAAAIRRDRIDILVDLAGHGTNNRLEVLGIKPAPIQATYLGYCATTGLPTIDYWITDSYLHPQDTSEVTSENIWRLPRCHVSFEPQREAPPVVNLPYSETGIFTFASFNHFRKITSSSLELWAEILKAVPNSRLILKCHGNERYDSPAAAKIQSALGEKGIDPQRISLYGDGEDQVNIDNRVDLYLDSPPHADCTAICEALWMGVPTLTLAGERKMHRGSATILHTLGLNHFIATSGSEYVEKAIHLVQNPDYLNSLRSTMRDRMLESELLDGKNMARAMEDAYRQMWHTYLSREGARGSAGVNPPGVEGLESSRAIKLLQNFIEDHPDIAEGYYQLGRVFHDLARTEVESEDEDEGLEMVFENLDNAENALSCYLEALSLSRSDPAVYSSLARLLLEQGLEEQAEQYYRCALLLDPGNQELLEKVGEFSPTRIDSPPDPPTGPAFLIGEGETQPGTQLETQPETLSYPDTFALEKDRKLHIGGTQALEGWEIFNARPGPAVDHSGNAKDLSRFADNTFSALYSSHVLEHFDYVYELQKVLREWYRVLSPGGILYTSVPDLDVLASILLRKDNFTYQDRMSVMSMIFGSHIDRYDYHLAGFNEEILHRNLKLAGFIGIEKVDNFNLFRDTSTMTFKGVPISLNMLARK